MRGNQTTRAPEVAGEPGTRGWGGGGPTEPIIVAILGGLVFLLALAVYAATAYRTVPFWDAGEFITTSWILGIPHQPSTPLYVLIGRLAALVPLGSIAFRVNMLSALAAAGAALFSYLAVFRMARLLAPHAALARYVAAVTAALFVAFSSTIWFNALEAEVYALSNLVAAISLWAVLRWRQRDDGDDRILLAVIFILSLAIGIHLGTLLVLPGLALLVALSRPHSVVTPGALGAWLALGLAWFLVTNSRQTAQGQISSGELWTSVLVFALAGLVLLAFTRRSFAWRFVAFAGALFVLGVSVHFFLLIRAGLDPVINEADPSTWSALMDTLGRKQYPPSNIFQRRAPLDFQFGHMFWGYLREQWPLVPRFLGAAVPLALAVWGGARQARQDRPAFWMMLAHLAFLGPFLVLYLNFTDREVRERDYFFAGFFQITALWIGLGLGALVVEASKRRAAWIAAGVALLIALAPLAQGWTMHDRSRDTIARDYAHNLLVPLPSDAILFTNGDNDTFPLWYMQHVEGFRKDVRIVNLSLLNTPWYIGQIRDGNAAAGVKPVPLSLTDEEIALLRPRFDASGKLLLVKDLMVAQILRDNAWRLPAYIAVTVPDKMGLEPQLTMECLAHRIHREPTDERINAERCRECLYGLFTPLGGIVDADGATDTSLYKTENERRLVQNYAAVHFYLAVHYDRQGMTEEALAEALRAEAISPGFPGNRHFVGLLYEDLGRFAEAENHYRHVLATYGEDFRTLHALGSLLERLGRTDEAVAVLTRSAQLAGAEYFEPHAALFEVYARLGRTREALAVLDTWLRYHPNDRRVREVRNSMARGEWPEDAAPGSAP